MIQIYLANIHCNEETDEVGADEPYVLVTAVNLASTVIVAGFPVPLPAFEVVRYGPFDDVDEDETHFALGISQSFWGLTNAPETLDDPDKVIFVVAFMENDNGDPDALRGIVKGIVGGSVLGSLSFDRNNKVIKLINDVNSALGTPTGAPNFDDKVGYPQELRFSFEELIRAKSGQVVSKILVFNGDGGSYNLTFEARSRSTGSTAQGDDMQPDEVLNPGQSVSSANGRYTFIYQSDSNLVLYRNSDGQPLWASNTDGRPNGVCIMQGDGNLVIYDMNINPIWSSDTWQHPGSHLIVQDDGNVVIYHPNGTPVWATNTVQ